VLRSSIMARSTRRAQAVELLLGRPVLPKCGDLRLRNDALLDDYFTDDYALHSPDGTFNRDEIEAYFAALRESFTDFMISRTQSPPEAGAEPPVPPPIVQHAQAKAVAGGNCSPATYRIP
jgi:hypothetical protein